MSDPLATQTAERQASMTPEMALRLLKEGNERFVTNHSLVRDYLAQVRETALAQYPHSVVLACIDSRVPVEIVFDQGIGDVFVPRIAGNFVNPDILGSMEYATAIAGAKLIVVLGHTECGAVKGACDHVELGHLTGTLANLAPAVEAVMRSHTFAGEVSSQNCAFVRAVAVENVRQVVRSIVARSSVIAGLAEAGDVRVVGAMHDVATGRVSFLAP